MTAFALTNPASPVSGQPAVHHNDLWPAFVDPVLAPIAAALSALPFVASRQNPLKLVFSVPRCKWVNNPAHLVPPTPRPTTATTTHAPPHLSVALVGAPGDSNPATCENIFATVQTLIGPPPQNACGARIDVEWFLFTAAKTCAHNGTVSAYAVIWEVIPAELLRVVLPKLTLELQSSATAALKQVESQQCKRPTRRRRSARKTTW